MGRNKNGYNDLVGNNFTTNAKNLVNNNLKCNQEVISKNNLKLLNNFFKAAKKNNIKLAFHVTPLYLESNENNFRSLNICNKSIIKELSDLIYSNNQCNLMINYPEEF